MDKKFYEVRPYLYLVISIIALRHAGESKLYLFSGALLLVAGALISHARLKHRGYLRG
ncbi:MAG: hypothetical protein K2X47_07980 [Bdellovibrionales bacterium]|nr:hypothetical protein [Bdellovibrionales bacterium]